MIRSKQMDELRKLDSSLRKLGEASKPSLEKHVMIAITSGEIPKLKPVSAITAAARSKIIAERYGSRELKFADVFLSCNGYDAEMKQFTAHEKSRSVALTKYSRSAEKIMLRALDKEADAELISEELHEAAERAGLKSITPPVWAEACAE
jgi:hypothetical protein